MPRRPRPRVGKKSPASNARSLPSTPDENTPRAVVPFVPANQTPLPGRALDGSELLEPVVTRTNVPVAPEECAPVAEAASTADNVVVPIIAPSEPPRDQSSQRNTETEREEEPRAGQEEFDPSADAEEPAEATPRLSARAVNLQNFFLRMRSHVLAAAGVQPAAQTNESGRENAMATPVCVANSVIYKYEQAVLTRVPYTIQASYLTRNFKNHLLKCTKDLKAMIAVRQQLVKQWDGFRTENDHDGILGKFGNFVMGVDSDFSQKRQSQLMKQENPQSVYKNKLLTRASQELCATDFVNLAAIRMSPPLYNTNSVPGDPNRLLGLVVLLDVLTLGCPCGPCYHGCGTTLLGCRTRWYVRRRYNIRGVCSRDLALSACCPFLVAVQNASEMQAHVYHGRNDIQALEMI